MNDSKIVETYRQKTQECVRTVPGGVSISELERIVLSDVKVKIEEYGLNVRIKEFCLTGSWSR